MVCAQAVSSPSPGPSASLFLTHHPQAAGEGSGLSPTHHGVRAQIPALLWAYLPLVWPEKDWTPSEGFQASTQQTADAFGA